MTPGQEATLENLNQKIRLLDQRLQRFADAMANRTTRRNKGNTRTDDPENDAADLSAWEAAMNRIALAGLGNVSLPPSLIVLGMLAELLTIQRQFRRRAGRINRGQLGQIGGHRRRVGAAFAPIGHGQSGSGRLMNDDAYAGLMRAESRRGSQPRISNIESMTCSTVRLIGTVSITSSFPDRAKVVARYRRQFIWFRSFAPTSRKKRPS